MTPHDNGGRRIVAYIIDAIIVGLLQLPLTLAVIYYSLSNTDFGSSSQPATPLDIFSFEFTLLTIGMLIVGMLISLAYFTFQETKSGQTIGKKLLDIKVVQKDLVTPITKDQAIKRNLARLLWSIPMGLGFIIMVIDTVLILTSTHQRIGDRLADTTVVKTTYIPTPGGYSGWIPPQPQGGAPYQGAPPSYGGQPPYGAPYGHYPSEGAPGPASYPQPPAAEASRPEAEGPSEGPYPESEVPPPEEPLPGDDEAEAPGAATEAEPAPSEKRERLPGDPEEL